MANNVRHISLNCMPWLKIEKCRYALCDAFLMREEGLTYYLEDTCDKDYRDVSAELSLRGWQPIANKKRSKLERKRFPMKDIPHLVWTINEKDLSFSDLFDFQICNHFEGVTQLTTKLGLCELLAASNWICCDKQHLSPRSYNLGDPIHRDEFVDDFRLLASLNVLKWKLLSLIERDIMIDTCGASDVVNLCLSVCCRSLRMRHYGEWPGVDRLFPDTDTVLGPSDVQWNKILDVSYALLEDESLRHLHCDSAKLLDIRSKLVHNTHQWTQPSSYCKVMKLYLIIAAMNKFCPQHGIDGQQNIWIVKSPEACRGVGMKVLHKLCDILGCERGMSGRIVQKYIENPLLIPLFKDPLSVNLGSKNKLNGVVVQSKFDIRVWVLVVSWQPLRAYVFTEVYGRKCGVAYTDNLEHLGNEFIHLTNYSVQKKVTKPSEAKLKPGMSLSMVGPKTGSTNASQSGVSAVRNLRAITGCAARQGVNLDTNDFPLDNDYGEDITKSNSLHNLLIDHEELMLLLDQRDCLMDKINDSTKANVSSSTIRDSTSGSSTRSVWADSVWPEMKKRISVLLEAAQPSITHRNRSFELLGVDVLIDNTLTPWILEVNMSPAMAHRNLKQSSLIARMATGLVELAVMPHIRSKGSISPSENISASEINDCVHLDESVPAATGDDAMGWEILYWGQDVVTPTSIPSSSEASYCEDCWGKRVASSAMLSVGKFDVTFAIVGKCISTSTIAFQDSCCSKFHSILLIQEWWRRYLLRLRLFVSRREHCRLRLQCKIRQWLAKCSVHVRLVTIRNCLLQGASRRFCVVRLSRLAREKRASCRIQTISRRWLAIQRVTMLKKILKVNIVKKWYLKHRQNWRWCAAQRIINIAKKWLSWRRRHAQVIYHLLALHYRRLRRCTRTLQRMARRWLIRNRLKESLRKVKLKKLSSAAATQANKLIAQRDKIALCRHLTLIEMLTFQAVQQVISYILDHEFNCSVNHALVATIHIEAVVVESSVEENMSRAASVNLDHTNLTGSAKAKVTKKCVTFADDMFDICLNHGDRVIAQTHFAHSTSFKHELGSSSDLLDFVKYYDKPQAMERVSAHCKEAVQELSRNDERTINQVNVASGQDSQDPQEESTELALESQQQFEAMMQYYIDGSAEANQKRKPRTKPDHVTHLNKQETEKQINNNNSSEGAIRKAVVRPRSANACANDKRDSSSSSRSNIASNTKQRPRESNIYGYFTQIQDKNCKSAQQRDKRGEKQEPTTHQRRSANSFQIKYDNAIMDHWEEEALQQAMNPYGFCDINPTSKGSSGRQKKAQGQYGTVYDGWS